MNQLEAAARIGELLRMRAAGSGEGDDPRSDYHAPAQDPFTPAHPAGLILVEQCARLHELESQPFASTRLTLPHGERFTPKGMRSLEGIAKYPNAAPARVFLTVRQSRERTRAHIARCLRYLNAGAPEPGGDRGPS